MHADYYTHVSNSTHAKNTPNMKPPPQLMTLIYILRMLKLILNKCYVGSIFDSVVIADRLFIANVTIIISAGWTGHLVLTAWHPKVGLVIYAWGRKTTSPLLPSISKLLVVKWHPRRRCKLIGCPERGLLSLVGTGSSVRENLWL